MGFLVAFTVLIRGTPCRARGSFINVGSNFAGTAAGQHFKLQGRCANGPQWSTYGADILLVMIVRTSPGIRPLGGVAAAVRHRWSYVSRRKSVFDLLNIDARPLFRFERIIWSKSMIDGSLAAFTSRSCMNSLKPRLC